jgi:hypothetical protein
MSKFMSLIRRAPKRFSAVVAMVAAAVIIPAVVFAWGPNRETFTIDNPSDHVQFNSITNNPNIGDERNFVGIREVGSSNVWHDNMNVQDGKEYFVRMYVHNNAASSLNLVAENVTAKFNLPTTTGKSVQVNGFLSASNVGADKNGNAGAYAEVYDHATFNSDKNFNLAYVGGSLKYENNVFGPNGTALPETIFTSAGAKLGYDKLDGKLGDQQALLSLFDTLSKDHTAAMLRINGLEQSRAEEKVAFTLYYLIFRYGTQAEGDEFHTISITLRHTTIAGLVGLTRESTSRILSNLQKQGIIDYRSGTYRVKKALLESHIGEDAFRDVIL